jgi:hypothetical protein
MKRFCFLAVLMTLSSSAYAGGSISFNGRRPSGAHRKALPFDVVYLDVDLQKP